MFNMMSCFWFLCIINVYCESYIRNNKLLSFVNHEDLCNFKYDTSLCSIHNQLQNIEATSLCSSVDCWIGLHKYKWNDASTFDFGNNISSPNTPWNGLQPNDTIYCVVIEGNSTSLWNHIECEENYKYGLCNYPSRIYIFNDNINYQRTPSISNLIGTMDILDEIFIEFD
eukprot:427742_1